MRSKRALLGEIQVRFPARSGSILIRVFGLELPTFSFSITALSKISVKVVDGVKVEELTFKSGPAGSRMLLAVSRKIREKSVLIKFPDRWWPSLRIRICVT